MLFSKWINIVSVTFLTSVSLLCFAEPSFSEKLPQQGVASSTTSIANQQFANTLPLDDPRDFKDANRGFIAALPDGKAYNEDGSLSVDAMINDYITGPAPDTVNPSLWRQSKLNRVHGLFKVMDGIYQLRGYCASTMTLIKGKSGWIVVDPLMSPAPVRAGIALADKHLGERPVSAIIYTHCHWDHFGGVHGALPKDKKSAARVEIIAPANFLKETIREHVLAGWHMGRRIWYQGGASLKPDVAGRMGIGLSQIFSLGPVGLVPPTKELSQGENKLVVDGIDFVFMDAGGTEAPAEFVFYLPAFKALQTAEIVCGTQHNVLTPRGAKVRDALKWSKVIDKVLARFGRDAEVLMASHHWPVWGNETVRRKLRNHRNLYRYIHDQTLRRANHGMTMHEIAEDLPLPQLAQSDLSTRGYYGNMKNNSRAVYQHYFGWWDGVPAHFNPLTPEAAARKHVEFMGGPEATLKKAIHSYEKGEYRWAATVLNYLVFSDPAHKEARQWLAATYEQMGFQAESAIVRNFYLMGALDLRRKALGKHEHVALHHDLPLHHFADVLAMRFDPAKFNHAPFVIEIKIKDSDKTLSLDVGPDVIFPRMQVISDPDFRLVIGRPGLNDLVSGTLSAGAVTEDRGVQEAITAMLSALDKFDPIFNIIEP